MADADSAAATIHHLSLPPSKVGMRQQATAVACGYGEIVAVEGGHIVRSTGRKDRHSKVCTAKGLRDRRVRLSAQTAIQLYDVQDRLGFDRPSKAVDWLIKKAKTAIDELAELPPRNPADILCQAAANAKTRRAAKIQASPPPPAVHEEPRRQFSVHIGGSSISEGSMVVGVAGEDNGSGFLPPSLDSYSIADNIKSLFPVGGACASTEAPPLQQLMQQSFHHHPPPDLLSRTSSHNQDLRLSLQTFQDSPPLLHHHHHQAEPVLFAGQNNPLGFDASTAAWEQPDDQSLETGRIQRLVAWNNGGGGFVFASPPPPPPITSSQSVLGQSQHFSSQGGPLQSINTPMIRAWFDPNHHHDIAAADIHGHPYYFSPAVYHSAIPGIGLASQTGELSGFCIPARIQVQEEEQDGITNKPSSVFSISGH